MKKIACKSNAQISIKNTLGTNFEFKDFVTQIIPWNTSQESINVYAEFEN